MSHSINVIRIRGVYHALEELRDLVVFVGGATISLYADNPGGQDVRPTNDIDILIEIGSYAAYAQLQEKLAALHFLLDAGSKVICRYKYQGYTVDIMPTDERILGFSNKWYKEGFAKVIQYQIDERTVVNILPSVYFIASKLEAFKGRGMNDGRTSRDFEDIVFVLDNRKNIWNELGSAPDGLKDYLKTECISLLTNAHLEEWLSVHLEYETATMRADMIIASMRVFVSNDP